VVDVDAQGAVELALSEDQQPVQAFGSCGPDEALGVRVGLRRAKRRLDHVDACGAEDVVEGGGELRVAVADQEGRRRGGSRNTSPPPRTSRCRWSGGISEKDLQMRRLREARLRRDTAGFLRFRVGLGLRDPLEVPIVARAAPSPRDGFLCAEVLGRGDDLHDPAGRRRPIRRPPSGALRVSIRIETT
jgi:hypothetical protein